MKILFDINHPAHFHVLKNSMSFMKEAGHEILVTSRKKDIATELLDQAGIDHRVLSVSSKKNIFGFIWELLYRDFALVREVRNFKPDLLVAVAGTFISHAGKLTGTASLAIYDSEGARLQNLITYPFLTRLLVPRCYTGWTPKGKTLRFNGYHELAYLHPDLFIPDKRIAKDNGIEENKKNVFMRMVSWEANHDVGHQGWSVAQLDGIIDWFGANANILISSEKQLPKRYERYRYKGDYASIHHVLANCDLFIGESATMASECAVLGVPAIYAADAYTGYMKELDEVYGLVKVVSDADPIKIQAAAEAFLQLDDNSVSALKAKLLDDAINVSSFISANIAEMLGVEIE